MSVEVSEFSVEAVPVEPNRDFVVQILPLGMIPGFIITSETLRRVQESETRRQEKKNNKNTKPPKPPRRPNGRLGRVALDF